MKAIRLAQMVLLAVGLAALGYCLAVYLEANRFQADQARRFTRELHRHAERPRRPLRLMAPCWRRCRFPALACP